jgi:TP901 family phage tail tape measure protein
MASSDYLLKFKGDSSGFNRSITSVQSKLTNLSKTASRTLTPYNRDANAAVPATYNLTRAIAKLQNRMSGMRASGTKVATTFNRIVTAMAGVGTTIVLFRTAAQAVVRFEKSMAEVAAITNANARAFSMMSREAQKLGATTMFSGQQAAQGLKFLAMAGLSASEATKSLRATLNLAQAGAIDLGTAADIATNIMTAFKLEAGDLTDVVDDIATTASRSNTSIQQLGDAMKYVSASAASYGISLQESAAAIGVLSDAGMQASMAGTGFRQVLVRIAGQSAAMRQGMQALGISFSEINPEVHSLQQILERFSQTSVTATQVSTMFGARAANAFNILLSGKEKLASLTTEMQNNNGVAQQMADVMGNSLFGQLKKVQSAYEDLFITQYKQGEVAAFIGEKIQFIADTFNYLSGKLSVYDEAASGATLFGDSISETYQKVEGFVSTIERIGESLITLIKIFVGFKVAGLAVAAFTALKTAMAPVGLGIKKITKDTYSYITATLAKRRAVKAVTTGNKLYAAQLATQNVALKKSSASIAFNSLAMQGGAIRTKLFGSAVLSSSLKVRGLSISLFGLQRGAKVASVAIKVLNASVGALAVVSRVAATAVKTLTRAVGVLFTPLLILMAVVEGIALVWDLFVSDSSEGTQKLGKEVGKLEDEVSQLKNTLDSEEMQIDVKKNLDGNFEKTTDRQGLPIGDNAPVKAFKDLRTEVDKIRLQGALAQQLSKAGDLAERLKASLKEAYELDDQDAIDSLIQQRNANQEIINQLQEKQKFINENADAYIAQVEAVNNLKGATQALNDASKKYATEAAELGDSVQGSYLMQLDAVEKLKLSVFDLMDAETQRQKQIADKAVQKYEDSATANRAEANQIRNSVNFDEDNTLGRRARELEEQAERDDVNAARMRRKSNRLDYAGPVSGQIEGDPEQKQGRQLSSEQQAAVYGMKDEVNQLAKDVLQFEGNVDFDDDISEKYGDLMERLQAQGINTGIGEGFGENDESNEAIMERIRATQNLIKLTEDLNIAQRMADALEKQSNADLTGGKTTEIEKEIEALQEVINLRNRLREIEKTNQDYAAATAQGTTVRGESIGEDSGTKEDANNPFKGKTGGSRALTRTSRSDNSALGEEAVFLDGGSFTENLPTLTEFFSKAQTDYGSQRAQNREGIDTRIGRQEEKVRLSKEKITDMEGKFSQDSLIGNSNVAQVYQNNQRNFKEDNAELQSLKKQRENMGGFTTTGSNYDDGVAKRGTTNLLANFQKAFAGTEIMDKTFKTEDGTEKSLGDLSPTDIQNATQEERTALDVQLLQTANDFISKMTKEAREEELVRKKINGLLQQATNKEAELIAKQLKSKTEAKLAADEEQRRLKILALQAQIMDVINAKAKLVEQGAPDPQDKKGVAQYKQSMGVLDDQQKDIQSEIKIIQAEAGAEKSEATRGLDGADKRIADEISKIRAEGGTNEDINLKIGQILANEFSKISANIDKEGDVAKDKEMANENLGNAEREKKLQDNRIKEEARQRKERANEAMKIAGNVAEGETKGQAGVSSLAAIGGGGGVGAGGNIEDKQLEVQQQARDVLITMLKVLQTPKEFEGKNEALNVMMNKLDNKELNVMLQGFNKLTENAKNPNLNKAQREGLRGQAQALLDGFGMKADKRNFNPEGNFLADKAGLNEKAAAPVGVMQGIKTAIKPIAPNAGAQPLAAAPTPMEVNTASMVAALQGNQSILQTIAKNTSSLNGMQPIAVNSSGGGTA